jgi:hypothetical protein
MKKILLLLFFTLLSNTSFANKNNTLAEECISKLGLAGKKFTISSSAQSKKRYAQWNLELSVEEVNRFKETFKTYYLCTWETPQYTFIAACESTVKVDLSGTCQ